MTGKEEESVGQPLPKDLEYFATFDLGTTGLFFLEHTDSSLSEFLTEEARSQFDPEALYEKEREIREELLTEIPERFPVNINQNQSTQYVQAQRQEQLQFLVQTTAGLTYVLSEDFSDEITGTIGTTTLLLQRPTPHRIPTGGYISDNDETTHRLPDTTAAHLINLFAPALRYIQGTAVQRLPQLK